MLRPLALATALLGLGVSSGALACSAYRWAGNDGYGALHAKSIWNAGVTRLFGR